MPPGVRVYFVFEMCASVEFTALLCSQVVAVFRLTDCATLSGACPSVFLFFKDSFEIDLQNGVENNIE